MNVDQLIDRLKHYLPAQAPLKDFIHHNTLHAFQHDTFYEGLWKSQESFGYKVLLNINEYREFYKTGRISQDVLEKMIIKHKGKQNAGSWMNSMLNELEDKTQNPQIQKLRSCWKEKRGVDLDNLVHPFLFRILGAYLDQGISIWSFPVLENGFWSSLKEMNQYGRGFLFKGKRAAALMEADAGLEQLLEILVAEESLYESYLYDQQFSHQGWSGMVSTLEHFPETLLDPRPIQFIDFVRFECLLEIDALDKKFPKGWQPLRLEDADYYAGIFEKTEPDIVFESRKLFHEAYEWTYYYQVLRALSLGSQSKKEESKPKFQAFFCIDDRECSIRRNLENECSECQTFGTPGFFSVEFYFRPEGSEFHTKVCPAPVTPRYMIRERAPKGKARRDVHFSKHTHNFYSGWFYTQTIGFWSAIRLMIQVFKPSAGPANTSSFDHMKENSVLTSSFTGDIEDGLQVGFTTIEMVDRVESFLKSTGLVEGFAPIIYVIGHGASSVNNPHYAAYDCGACSGKAGSANARVFCEMANKVEVRKSLMERGIEIPETTRFISGLHDTTRDEIQFYDEDILNAISKELHEQNKIYFQKALHKNAVERARKFENIPSDASDEVLHEYIRKRSISLFEPRPELNHANNALCLIGLRDLSRSVFLDRRAFLQSYDYRIDPQGEYLLKILSAAAPVCGGINLEYFFSRVDNMRLGAGTKLPHNVMGLIGVANGIDGDLRPGLPSQMIELHEPVRLLMIVQHFPEVILSTIQRNASVFEWFDKEWIHLVCFHPEKEIPLLYEAGSFTEIDLLHFHIPITGNNLHEWTRKKQAPVVSLIND